MKTIITFGSGQLTEFFVRPTSVMLVIEADDENEARGIAFDFPGIGGRFCTSYEYTDENVMKFHRFGMKEYTLEDLENLRIRN